MGTQDLKHRPGRRVAKYSDLAAMCAEIPMALRVTRRTRGLSLRAAAAEIGISSATISRVESGQGYTVGHLRAILRWLSGGA